MRCWWKPWSESRVDLVCLAGFMRLLGPTFIDAFPQRILNIHPSLLPAFPGLDAQQQAFAHGVTVAGATVHFVSAELDAGPIVMQRAVAVQDDDTAETLAARILEVEHSLYPEAIALVLEGKWRLDGRRFLRNAARRRRTKNEGRRTERRERRTQNRTQNRTSEPGTMNRTGNCDVSGVAVLRSVLR